MERRGDVSDDRSARRHRLRGTAAAEGTAEPPATVPTEWDVEATGTCDGGPMTMWERSGGNAQMVDALVAAWNQVYPDCQIELTYICTPRWCRSWPRASKPATCPT